MNNTGWKASLELEFDSICVDNNQAKTVLKKASHFGPLRVQRPFYHEPNQDICHLYILHPPGGVVGGDSLTININLKNNAHAVITSPGSSKFYRSAGQTGLVKQLLKVGDNASLEWFMQENIFFNGAKTKLNTDIILSDEAKFIGWDISCLGRPACKEWFISGEINANFSVYRNSLKNPLLIERLRIGESYFNSATKKQGALLRGYPMQASFVATNCSQAILEQSYQFLTTITDKTKLPIEWGITLLDDILVFRALGEQTQQLQQIMIPLWQLLRPLILQRKAVLPRIWAT